jgi:hypothetical protein
VTFSDADFSSISVGAIPYGTLGQCARYRLYLTTTDTNTTPILSDITFNYSL